MIKQRFRGEGGSRHEDRRDKSCDTVSLVVVVVAFYIVFDDRDADGENEVLLGVGPGLARRNLAILESFYPAKVSRGNRHVCWEGLEFRMREETS